MWARPVLPSGSISSDGRRTRNGFRCLPPSIRLLPRRPRQAVAAGVVAAVVVEHRLQTMLPLIRHWRKSMAQAVVAVAVAEVVAAAVAVGVGMRLNPLSRRV